MIPYEEERVLRRRIDELTAELQEHKGEVYGLGTILRVYQKSVVLVIGVIGKSQFNTRSLIIDVVPKFAPPPISTFTWEMIGGQKAAKQELRMAVELPYTKPKLFKNVRQQTAAWDPPARPAG